jgi:hypothetical protein
MAKHPSEKSDNGKASATQRATAVTSTNYWTYQGEERHEAQSGPGQAQPSREPEDRGTATSTTTRGTNNEPKILQRRLQEGVDAQEYTMDVIVAGLTTCKAGLSPRI